MEIEVSFRDVISHVPEGKYSKIAPIRILSFDIECAAKQGRFPNSDIDPVIQIANYCIEFGKSEPIVCKLFSLGKCAAIAGVDINSHKEESDMLEDWNKFLIEYDPDIITGYNINNFDLPYLIGRANKLKVDSFKKMSKI